jgi:prepilin-type processing-associated H-X9-DG protein
MTQCLSNERTIGQAMQMYSNDNKGAICPCIINGYVPGTAAASYDYWPMLLIAGNYLPDPRIMAANTNEVSAATNSVLVCPAVRDFCTYNDIAGATTVTGADGFERHVSVFLMPGQSVGNTSTPPDPLGNGARIKGGASVPGAMIVDIGYGVNGDTNTTGIGAAQEPMGWIYDDPHTPTLLEEQYGQIRRVTQFARSSDTVLLFDGTGWDPANDLSRISGSRHGNWLAGRPTWSGICNVLFLDGHAAPIQRAELPNTSGILIDNEAVNANDITGQAPLPATNGFAHTKYVWNFLEN